MMWWIFFVIFSSLVKYSFEKTARVSLRQFEDNHVSYDYERLNWLSNGEISGHDLANHKNLEFYGEISLGTPSQVFKVLIDMTTSDLWVPSYSCVSLACDKHNKFDSENSSTFEAIGKNFSINYKNGFVKGYISSEKFCIGDLCVKDQTFGEVLQESKKPFLRAKYDGVLGFGFSKISQFESSSFFSNLVDQGIVEKRIFSIWLNLQPSDISRGGQLILGGTDPAFYVGNITYVDLIKKDFWRIKMKSISVNGRHTTCGTIGNPGCVAIIDPGSDIIIGPYWDVKVLNNKIGATQIQPGYGYYSVKCKKISDLPDIDIMIGGRNFRLKPEEYVVKKKIFGRKRCLSGFVGDQLSMGPWWIMGNNFLGSYYSVFDAENARVGFADVQRNPAI